MTLLDAFPHLATAKVRTASIDAVGGNVISYTTVFTDRTCWVQSASDSEIQDYDQRGLRVTSRIYFLADPVLDATHILTDLRGKNATAGTGDTFEVRSAAILDASSGLGVVWRVMADYTTTGSSSQE